MDIIEKYRLLNKEIKISDICINLYHTDNLDSFFDNLDPAEYEKDERFPYFVNIWQSGLNLTKYLVEEFPRTKIAGSTFLELGSGTGITGLALSLLGGHITFSDYEEDSLRLCEVNSAANNITNYDTILADWRHFPESVKRYDYIIGSDLLYEKRFLVPLVTTTKKLMEKGSKFIYADPGRNYYLEYLDMMRDGGFRTELLKDVELEKNQKIKIFLIEK
jgi:ETFB lysine methyltransferase